MCFNPCTVVCRYSIVKRWDNLADYMAEQATTEKK